VAASDADEAMQESLISPADREQIATLLASFERLGASQADSLSEGAPLPCTFALRRPVPAPEVVKPQMTVLCSHAIREPRCNKPRRADL
jgi:hypothetical protein